MGLDVRLEGWRILRAEKRDKPVEEEHLATDIKRTEMVVEERELLTEV